MKSVTAFSWLPLKEYWESNDIKILPYISNKN